MSRSPEPSVEAGPGSRSVQADDRTQQLYLVHASALRQFLHGGRTVTARPPRTWCARRFGRHRRCSSRQAPTRLPPRRSLTWRDGWPSAMSGPGRAGPPNRARGTGTRETSPGARPTSRCLALKQLSAEHCTVIAQFSTGVARWRRTASCSFDEATVSSRAYQALRAFRCAIHRVLTVGTS